jgi:hypothetical protein
MAGEIFLNNISALSIDGAGLRIVKQLLNPESLAFIKIRQIEGKAQCWVLFYG